ncbi:hypothetical protein GCM10010990_16450 [Croceicoccus mobilis]|uniref:Sulfotransferase domain-containing protein n=1 Tax=Croceicoccus mobilis TaxID=1703339 RepID=A0A916YZ84_9SPHN|nr:hypothetical protein GCM10010990_16450 [Croceicoccus mobilis]
MGKNRWISGHPRDALYIDQILPLFAEGDIHVLYLVRHPQEVAWSSINAPWAGNLSWLARLKEARRAARHWGQFGANAIAARDGRLGPNVKLVWHRDLLINPEAAMRGILEHVGEDYDERVVSAITKTTNSSFKEKTDSQAKLLQRADEIARHKLFCAAVTSEVADYMTEFGFEDYGSRSKMGGLYNALSPVWSKKNAS